MGAGLTRTLDRVLPETGPTSIWVKNARGPTLQRLFGAYKNPDLWALYRRLKKIDANGSGYLSYEELSQLLGLPEFNLLFLFDLFSQQNSIVNSRELMTTVCVFSSARLGEKGRFLMSQFDASNTGTCTGAEIAQMSVAALGVLARCTGAVVKVKDVAGILRDELPGLLPVYRELLKKRGSSRAVAEKCFKEDRCIAQVELDQLLPSLQRAYDVLPLAHPAPPGALPPPAMDWGEAAPPVAAQQAQVPHSPAGGGSAAARALRLGAIVPEQKTKQPLLTEAQVMKKHAEEEKAAELTAKADAERAAELAAKAEASVAAKAALLPAKGTLHIHGYSLADIESNMSSFRYLFVKSLSAALGIPSGCVEVLDILQGSIKVEFCLHPAGRQGDHRDGAALLGEVSDQLLDATSALRRGKFKEYAASAEILREGEKPRDDEAPPPAIMRRKVMCDAQEQAQDLGHPLASVLALLQRESDACEAEHEGLREANDEVARLGAQLAQLRQLKKDREEQRRRQAEEQRLRLEEEERQRPLKEAREEEERTRKAEEEERRAAEQRRKDEAEEEEKSMRREQAAAKKQEEEEEQLRREQEAAARTQKDEEERLRQEQKASEALPGPAPVRGGAGAAPPLPAPTFFRLDLMAMSGGALGPMMMFF